MVINIVTVLLLQAEGLQQLLREISSCGSKLSSKKAKQETEWWQEWQRDRVILSSTEPDLYIFQVANWWQI